MPTELTLRMDEAIVKKAEMEESVRLRRIYCGKRYKRAKRCVSPR
jgi:ribosomal protein L31E